MNTKTENHRVCDGTSWGWLCYLWIAVIAASLSIHIDLLNWCLLRLEILMKHFSGGLYFLWWNQRSHTFFCRKEQRGKKQEKRLESKSMASELTIACWELYWRHNLRTHGQMCTVLGYQDSKWWITVLELKKWLHIMCSRYELLLSYMKYYQQLCIYLIAVVGCFRFCFNWGANTLPIVNWTELLWWN